MEKKYYSSCYQRRNCHFLMKVFVIFATMVIKGISAQDSPKCKIQVLPPVQNGSNSSFVTALPGSNITLRCTYLVSDTISDFRWLLNYQDITQTVANMTARITNRTSVLYLLNAQRGNAGRYGCVIRGSVWVACSINVQILEAPRIVLSPSSRYTSPLQMFTKQETAVFHCYATGWPKPRVYWLRGNHVIENEDENGSYLIETQDGGVDLKILSIQRKHAGNYTCRAENSVGRVNHYIWVVISEPIPPLSPILKAIEPTVYVSRGQAANLSCFGKHALELYARSYWVHNDTMIDSEDGLYTESEVYDSDDPKQTVRLTLHVSNVTERETGNYTCVTRTHIGKGSAVITLAMSETKEAPRIVLSPSSRYTSPLQMFTKQETAVFHCYATGWPKPRVYWLRGNHVIENEDENGSYLIETQDGGVDLKILSIQRNHAGNYTCRAENSVGRVDHYISVVVSVLTVVRKKPKKGGTTVIAVTATVGLLLGASIVAIAWHLRKKKRENMMHSTFTHLDFQYDVFITYSSKDYGWVRDELIPLLEQNNLCYSIHCRDFEIGKAIMDNMAEFIYKSRMILAVMSTNYMSSKFCRGELDMALYRNTEKDDASLIIVKLDQIDTKKLPRSLRNRTFLDYADKTERKTWKQRLVKHLESPLVIISDPAASKDIGSTIPLVTNSSGRAKSG